MSNDSNAVSGESNKELGRNEPCPCGSGKKYKRCHGVSAAPKLSAPKPFGGAPAEGAAGAAPAMPGGFDPSKMDPQMMLQFSQALQRLPRGQLQKLQNIMQRAMSGKDVTREAEEFERTLPVELQTLMMSFAGQMPGMGAMGGGMPGMGGMPQAPIDVPSTPSGESESGMTEEQARQIVAAAAAEGKISESEAEKLLAASSQGTDEEKKKGFTKFWRGITGKSS
jgi:hypothetical protein